MWQNSTDQFFFEDNTFGTISKSSSLNLKSSMFSSKNCTVLYFIYRALVYFELILVKDVWSISIFIFIFYIWMSSIKTICWKRLSFIHRIAFASLSTISTLHLYASVSGLFTLFHWSTCLFTNTTLSSLLSLYSNNWSQIVMIFNFVLFFQFSVGYS